MAFRYFFSFVCPYFSIVSPKLETQRGESFTLPSVFCLYPQNFLTISTTRKTFIQYLQQIYIYTTTIYTVLGLAEG